MHCKQKLRELVERHQSQLLEASQYVKLLKKLLHYVNKSRDTLRVMLRIDGFLRFLSMNEDALNLWTEIYVRELKSSHTKFCIQYTYTRGPSINSETHITVNSLYDEWKDQLQMMWESKDSVYLLKLGNLNPPLDMMLNVHTIMEEVLSPTLVPEPSLQEIIEASEIKIRRWEHRMVTIPSYLEYMLESWPNEHTVSTIGHCTEVIVLLCLTAAFPNQYDQI